MRQLGAAVTDVALLATFVHAAMQLKRCCPNDTMPRWCNSVVWACMSGSLACICGCFGWLLELNLRHPHEMEVWEVVIADGMVLGMFGEAVALLVACVGMSPGVNDQSFNRWTQLSVALELLCCIYISMGHLAGLSVSYLMLPIAFVGVALTIMVLLAGAYVLGVVVVASGSEAKASWWCILIGSGLTLLGAAVLAALDSDCAGPYCITEALPWESAPCRWNTADPPGSSCPLPEVFNHAAVMHLFAIAGVSLLSRGVQGLLSCGWEPDALASGKKKQWRHSVGRSKEAATRGTKREN